jgi:Uma2 family endonuclease
MPMSSASQYTHELLVPPLVEGDRMKQPEFHRRYEAYPEGVKFELIAGIVYMASPLRWPHGNYDMKLGLVLELYASGTPGVEGAHNATTILSAESEPQPDSALRLLPEWGGQSRLDAGRYVQGAPEWLAEIAYSSRDIDLREKRDDYQQAGVVEYVVLCIEEQELHWFHFPSGRPIKPNRAGIYRSRVFPGLWVDGRALLARDSPRLIAVVQQGLASREHARFVKRLRAAHDKLRLSE